MAGKLMEISVSAPEKDGQPDFPYAWSWRARLISGEVKEELQGDRWEDVDETQVEVFWLAPLYNGYPTLMLTVEEDKRIVFHRRHVAASFLRPLSRPMIPPHYIRVQHVLGWVSRNDPDLCCYLLLDENGHIQMSDSPDAA